MREIYGYIYNDILYIIYSIFYIIYYILHIIYYILYIVYCMLYIVYYIFYIIYYILYIIYYILHIIYYILYIIYYIIYIYNRSGFATFKNLNLCTRIQYENWFLQAKAPAQRTAIHELWNQKHGHNIVFIHLFDKIWTRQLFHHFRLCMIWLCTQKKLPGLALHIHFPMSWMPGEGRLPEPRQ
jgi:hypothetical protein